MNYLLNQREYYEEKFEIKSEYYNSEFISQELDNFLNASHYEVTVGSRQIIIKND